MPSKHTKQLWYGVLAVTMVVWSSNYIVFKLLLVELDPVTVLLYRYVFASCMVVGIFLAQRSYQPTVTRSDWLWLALGTTSGTIIGGGSMLYAITLAGASVTSILINTSPLFVALIAIMASLEKLSWQKLIGITVGIAGVVSVVLGDSVTGVLAGTNHSLGVLVAIIGSFGIAIATITGKLVTHRIGGLFVTVMSVLPAAVCILIALLIINPELLIISQPIQWLGLMYTGAVGTALTWWLYTASLAHIDASATASFKLLIPVCTAIIAMIWLNEQLTTRSVLGMLCIIGGILLVIKQRTTTNYVSPPN